MDIYAAVLCTVQSWSVHRNNHFCQIGSAANSCKGQHDAHQTVFDFVHCVRRFPVCHLQSSLSGSASGTLAKAVSAAARAMAMPTHCAAHKVGSLACHMQERWCCCIGINCSCTAAQADTKAAAPLCVCHWTHRLDTATLCRRRCWRMHWKTWPGAVHTEWCRPLGNRSRLL